jgi:uncharacterized membrane protein YbhN (UPF0104 family)
VSQTPTTAEPDVPTPPAPPAPPPRRRLAALWTVLRWLAVAAIVWFVARALAGGIREVNWAGLRVHWGWLSLSPLPVVVALTMEAWAVRLAYRSFGASFALPRTLFLVALPQLGKYLPGKVLALAGHVALAKGYGASGKVIASVLVLLQFLAILASILLSLASLALSTAEAPALRVIKFVLLASAAGGVVLLLAPRLYLWVINQGLRLVRRQPLRSTLDVGTMLKLAALLTARTLAFSLGFALMAQAVVPLPLSAVTDLVGAFCLANLVGYIALFAPAGIGVREWMYVILLGAVMSRPDAALVTALARVWQTVMDLVIVALGFGAVAIWPEAKPPPLPPADSTR